MKKSYYLDEDNIKLIRQAIENLQLTDEIFYDAHCHISKTTYYKMMRGECVSIAIMEAVKSALIGKLKQGEKLVWKSKSQLQTEQEYENGEIKNNNNGQFSITDKQSSSKSLASTVNSNSQDNHDVDDLDARFAKIQKTIESRINEKCGKIRILKMREPVPTLKLYVNLDICSQQNKERLHLDDSFADELVQREKNNQPHSQRLIVVGTTGSGKSMLLRSLALSCFQEKSFLKEKGHLPIYIRLREYTEKEEKISDLEQYIVREYNIEFSDIALLSQNGQLLILFDGFDSIESDNRKFVYHQINTFIDRFPNNDYIISCKAEKQIFERFEKVELSPLDYKQICNLVKNRIKVNSPYLSRYKKNKLLTQIKNDQDLLVIAQNPLLLVLICLIYAERGIDGLKKQKWKVIYEAISVLLEGWDREQGITDETETNFSKTDKAKFLSFVAFHSTLSGRDCLDQQTLEDYISEYIQNTLSTHPNLTPQKIYTIQDILTSLESEHTLLLKRSDWKYEFSKQIFKDVFTMFFIRKEFKSLDKFKSQDVFLENSTRWERFLKVAESAYPIIFENELKLNDSKTL